MELIFQDELTVRQERVLKRRTKAADFRHLKTLEEFDWQFNPTINHKQIYELPTGAFFRKSTDVFFVGPPGVGKTHLTQAIGYEAIKMNFDVIYRSIFNLVHDFLKDEAFNQQEVPVSARDLREKLNFVTPSFGIEKWQADLWVMASPKGEGCESEEDIRLGTGPGKVHASTESGNVRSSVFRGVVGQTFHPRTLHPGREALGRVDAWSAPPPRPGGVVGFSKPIRDNTARLPR